MAYRRKVILTNPNSADPRVKNFRRQTPTQQIGLTVNFDNPNGIFTSTVTNREQVLNNLKNLLLTAKGERYFQPDFGTDLKKMLFENITTEEEFSQNLKSQIESAIATWLPYLLITQLTVNFNMTNDGRVPDPTHAVGIFLEVLISGTNIYLPVRIFISETADIQIEEAQN